MAGKDKNLEARLSSKQRLKERGGRTESVPVHTDEEAVERLTKIRLELRQEYQAGTRAFRTEEAAAAHQARIEAIKAREALALQEVKDTTITLRFRSIGRDRYKSMIADHPPTQTDHDSARVASGKPDDESIKAAWNQATFPADLIVASCFDPGFDDVGELLDITADWNEGEWDRLFMAAFQCNTQARVVDLGGS